MGQVVGQTHGLEHIGRLQGGGGAGGTGGDRHLGERGEQHLAVHALERHVQMAGQARRVAPVEMHAGQRRDLVPEPVTQPRQARLLGVALGHGQRQGFAHADDLVGGQGAGAHVALVAAAVDLRAEAHVRMPAHVQRAHALGAVELVRAQRQHVHRRGAHVQGQLAGGLGGVAVEQHAGLAANRADGVDVVDHPGFVVGVHDRHQHGVLAQGVRHRPGVDAAVRARRQVGHWHTGTLQPAAGVEHRLVFAGGGDHMAAAALLHHALDGQVVGLGGAAGPDDFTGVRVERVRHLAAGVFHRLFRQPAVQMAA